MIGIAVTTVPERKKILNKTLKQIEKYAPDDMFLYVHVDKAYKGIPYAKNACLKELYDAGCEYFFLFDDDTYPLKKDWYKPYIESGKNHLMYQFKLPDSHSSDMREIYRNKDIVAYSHTRGAMLFCTRKVVDTVGGFDMAYGKGTFEHPDWTNRIYNAGLTTHRAMDVIDSNKLLYCLDQDKKVKSSISTITRTEKLKNALYYRENRHSKEYKEFKK